MTTRWKKRSPLSVPYTVWNGPGKRPGETVQMAGFPVDRFWREGRYYQSDDQAWHPIWPEANVGEHVYFPAGSYWLCLEARQRSFCSDENDIDADITGIYVRLLGLHPRSNEPIEVRGFPAATFDECFSLVENEMVILALAASGLAT